MERVKDSQILAWVKRMQGQGIDIGVDGQYGKFRVTNRSGSTNLSPRAPNREILDWLDAYDKGWSAGREFQFDRMRKEAIDWTSAGDSACAALVEKLADNDQDLRYRLTTTVVE